MAKSQRKDYQSHFELFVGNILQIGVTLAATLVLLGGLLYLLKHGTESPNYSYFTGKPTPFSSPEGVVNSILSGRRQGIIQLGILLMIATPVVRVLFSLLTFIQQRDFTYIIITVIVLIGLVYGLIS
jgi:uncharacterized membrane protein